MSDDIVENLKRPSVWLRILFMIGFAVALYVTAFILLVLVVAQILFALFSGANNDNLRRFGAALTEYIHQILLYLTFNSEQRPFPFAPFPLLEMSDTVDAPGNAQTTASAHAGNSAQTASDPASSANTMSDAMTGNTDIEPAIAPEPPQTVPPSAELPLDDVVDGAPTSAAATVADTNTNTNTDTANTDTANTVTSGTPANSEENPIDEPFQHDDSPDPGRPSSG